MPIIEIWWAFLYLFIKIQNTRATITLNWQKGELMLNRAQQIMNERENMINEAKQMINEGQQILAALQATEEEMIYHAPMTNIIINKGRIIEVPITKEVVVNNTNDETAMLRETIRQMNAVMNDMNKEKEELKAKYIQQMEDMTSEFEYEYECAINKREEKIKELQEKLDFKELLLSEFRDNMDEKIKATHKLEEELEIKEAMIENLKMRLKAAESRTHAVEQTKEEEKHEEPQNTEGGDAMSSLINVSDKYMAYPEIVELINYWTDYVNGITEDKKMLGQIVSKETLRQKAIQKANEEIANLMSEIDKRLAYNITHDETYAANGITSTYGKITLGGKEYAFKYDATFEKPVVYGCMNMDLINEAKAALDALVHLDRDETTLGQKHANQPVYDFENNIVVWVSDDGVFKGYTDKYAFVWDPAQAQPCGITVINALSNFRKYRKMNASWGNGFVARANFIMRYCRQMVNRVTNDKEVPEDTNEIIVNVTKDKEPQVTNEEVETLWDDFDC